MAALLKLAARWAVRLPRLLPLVRWILPNTVGLLAGKPQERRLLVYDLGSHMVALANDAKDIETVLLDREQRFPKSMALEALLQPMIGDGVFGQPGGQTVKATRRLFIHALARIDDEEVAQVSRVLTREYVRRWLADTSSSTVPICTELARLTIDIVSQCTLSQRFSDQESREFTRLFLDYQRRCVSLPLLFCERSPRIYQRAVRGMGLERNAAILRECVRSRFLTEACNNDTLLSSPFGAMLAEAGLLGPNHAGSSARALNEIMVMLLAGHETTASALSWLSWELGRRPNLQEAATAILAPTNPATHAAPHSAARTVAENDWQGLDGDALLNGLTREALRLYPPIAFFLRDVERDTTFRGKLVSRGSFLLVSPWALHRHRKRWKRPDEFLPERWWKGEQSPARTDYLPYGMGTRACPGSRFADIEMREIVRVLLTECRFTAVDQPAPKPLGSLTSRPDREIRLSIRARNTPNPERCQL